MQVNKVEEPAIEPELPQQEEEEQEVEIIEEVIKKKKKPKKKIIRRYIEPSSSEDEQEVIEEFIKKKPKSNDFVSFLGLPFFGGIFNASFSAFLLAFTALAFSKSKIRSSLVRTIII